MSGNRCKKNKTKKSTGYAPSKIKKILVKFLIFILILETFPEGMLWDEN